MSSSPSTSFEPSPELVERFRALSLVCGVLVTAVGATALIGWIRGDEGLKSVFAGPINIKTNTAICLMLCGTSLLLLLREPVGTIRRRIAIAVAVLPIAIGVATLIEHLSGWDLGIDQLLFWEAQNAMATQSPNRMGPPASIGMPLLGWALIRVARSTPGRGPSTLLPLIVMILAAMPILGYVFDVREMFGVARYTGIALHTAIAMALAAIGIMAARMDTGLISLLGSRQPGGMMLRRMLPAAILVPAVLGLLHLQGEELGWFDVTFGRVLLVLTFTIVFSAITWWSAAAVSRHAVARVRAEAAEQELKGRLLSIVETVSQGFFSLDRDGRCTYVNPVGERLAGASRDALLGRRLVDALPAASTPALAEAIARARTSHAVEHVETFAPEPRIWFEHDVVPTAEGAAVFTRDITESRTRDEERRLMLDRERAARNAAEHSNRMKDEFLATLSHELRSPLNAILGWARLLSEGGMPQDETRRGVESIERNARMQVQLIEDLLDMSRIVSGKVHVTLEPVDAVAVMDAALAAVTPAATAGRLRIERSAPRVAMMVRADAARLQQVVGNLLSNAVKFTPENGTVCASILKAGDRVEIEVSDNGQGIAPEFLPHVFDRFRQADASTTRTYGGLGLGLAIARELIEMQGGTLEARSEGVGHGSAFTVRIPAVEASPFQAPDPVAHDRVARPRPSARLASVRVLVVDDQADGREVVERLLRDRQADVIGVPSVARALELFETRTFDVLVSDIAMPGRDGHDLIRALRSRQKWLPAIALTAFARPEDRQRALAAGYDMHLPKPVDPDRLAEAIAALVPTPARPRGEAPSSGRPEGQIT